MSKPLKLYVGGTPPIDRVERVRCVDGHEYDVQVKHIKQSDGWYVVYDPGSCPECKSKLWVMA
jgi:hypothetical protein